MLFRCHTPRGPLANFVGLFWYCEGYHQPRALERLIPTGTVELVIELASGRAADSLLCGPKTRPCTIERTARDATLGVHFKPGGVFPFLRFPTGELLDCDVALGDVWGEGPAHQLLDALHEAATVEAKFHLLEQWLVRTARRPLERHPAVSFALRAIARARDPFTTADIVEAANVSHRRFIRLFRDETGLPPKVFSRIRRFQRAVQVVHRGDGSDWLDVAFACRYYDQAHFIHEFQEFAGLTPTAYLRLRTGHPNHVRIGG